MKLRSTIYITRRLEDVGVKRVMTVCVPVLHAGAYAAAAHKLRGSSPPRLKDLRGLCKSHGLPTSKYTKETGPRHLPKAALIAQLRSAELGSAELEGRPFGRGQQPQQEEDGLKYAQLHHRLKVEATIPTAVVAEAKDVVNTNAAADASSDYDDDDDDYDDGDGDGDGSWGYSRMSSPVGKTPSRTSRRSGPCVNYT
jgi:hypothetical protein